MPRNEADMLAVFRTIRLFSEKHFPNYRGAWLVIEAGDGREARIPVPLTPGVLQKVRSVLDDVDDAELAENVE